jgi:hypothetical protein
MSARDKNRLAIVLEWIRLSQQYEAGAQRENRIVMATMAFEILFELPRWSKAPALAERFDDLFTGQGLRMHTRHFGKGSASKNLTPPRHSRAAWWLHDLYQVRNKVVHTGRMPTRLPGSIGRTDPLVVAPALLYICLLAMLVKRGAWTNNMLRITQMRKQFLPDEPALPKEVLFFGEGNHQVIFKALGWM